MALIVHELLFRLLVLELDGLCEHLQAFFHCHGNYSKYMSMEAVTNSLINTETMCLIFCQNTLLSTARHTGPDAEDTTDTWQSLLSIFDLR
jgi:hypothetical protein